MFNKRILTYLLTYPNRLVDRVVGWVVVSRSSYHELSQPHTMLSLIKIGSKFWLPGVEICLFLVVVRNLLLREISNRERLKKHSIVTYFLLYLLHALSSYHGN